MTKIFFTSFKKHMNIQPISFNSIYLTKKRSENINQTSPQTNVCKTDLKCLPNSYNICNISFTSRCRPIVNNVYNQFSQEYARKFGNTPIVDVVKETLKSGTKIGQGHEKAVYLFPELSQFLVAHLFQKAPQNRQIKGISAMELPKYNFGQPFASNGHDILLTRKLEGVCNGLDYYIETIMDIFKNNAATPAMSKSYLGKLRLLKDFPQKSYDDLVGKIEYANGFKYIIDTYNPNNILIDTKRKELNIIDVATYHRTHSALKEKYPRIDHQASVFELISVLVDAKFQSVFLEQMTQKEKTEAISISQDIIEKCLQATKNSSLLRDDYHLTKLIKCIDRRFGGQNADIQQKSYSKFKELYKDYLSEI